MSRYRWFRCRQRYRLWECGLINKSDRESTYSNHIHESRLACREQKEVSVVLACWCLHHPYPSTAAPLRSAPFLQTKENLGVKVLIRKVRRSSESYDLTFFPEQGLEPVQDFVDDGEHDSAFIRSPQN